MLDAAENARPNMLCPVTMHGLVYNSAACAMNRYAASQEQLPALFVLQQH